MKRVTIKSKTVEKWNRDELTNVVERSVTVDGVKIRIPEIGEYDCNANKITDLANLQLQWTFSHGGNNPPQGTSNGYLVAANTAKNSSDVGHNKSAGLLCRVVGNHLEIENAE